MKYILTVLAALLFLVPVVSFADVVDPSVVVDVVPTLGGGGQVFCSSPTAPGWNVSLPHGGCGGTSSFITFGAPLPTGEACMFWGGCMVK